MKLNIGLLMTDSDSFESLLVPRETKPLRLKDCVNRSGHPLLGKADRHHQTRVMSPFGRALSQPAHQITRCCRNVQNLKNLYQAMLL